MTMCPDCREEAARLAISYGERCADAIRALPAGDTVRVQREPTNEMLERAWDACSKANMEISDGDPNAGPSIFDLRLAWKVMLSAASARS